MKKFLFLAGFLFWELCAAHAQTAAGTLVYRKEIGISTLPVYSPLFSARSHPLQLIYKWGTAPSLFRLGASLGLSYRNTLNNALSVYNIEPAIFIGKEFRKTLADRWKMNYGGDLRLNFASRASRSRMEVEGDPIKYFNYLRERGYGAGFRSFVGILFELNNHLVLGTEASFRAGLERLYRTSTPYAQENGHLYRDYDVPVTGEHVWRLGFNLQPAGSILLYYRF